MANLKVKNDYLHSLPSFLCVNFGKFLVIFSISVVDKPLLEYSSNPAVLSYTFKKLVREMAGRQSGEYFNQCSN